METKPTDIFESDQLFIGWASLTLLVIGMLGLASMLFCKLTTFGWCDSTWIPLFGGFQIFQNELATVNLPLAMIILGIGLRLPTGFGWTTCVLLLTLLCTLFGFLSYWLLSKLDSYQAKIASNEILPQDYPILESIVVDVFFVGLCVLGLIYLSQTSVRRLYWQQNVPPSDPTSPVSSSNPTI